MSSVCYLVNGASMKSGDQRLYRVRSAGASGRARDPRRQGYLGASEAARAGKAKGRTVKIAAHRDRFIGNVLGSWFIACGAMDVAFFFMPDTLRLAPWAPAFELAMATGVAALAVLLVPSLCSRFVASHVGWFGLDDTHYSAWCGRLAGLLLGVLGDIALQWI